MGLSSSGTEENSASVTDIQLPSFDFAKIYWMHPKLLLSMGVLPCIGGEFHLQRDFM